MANGNGRNRNVSGTGIPVGNMPDVDAWEGFDFLTIDSGINPLIASYSGAPHSLRGVDTLGYARETQDWWNTSAQDVTREPPPVVQAGIIPFDIPTLDQIKAGALGAVGSLLAIVIIAIGLYVLLIKS